MQVRRSVTFSWFVLTKSWFQHGVSCRPDEAGQEDVPEQAMDRVNCLPLINNSNADDMFYA